MGTKKHSKLICDKIIEKYQTGEGYKKISKALNISRSSVRAIINKWKEYGTAVNLPRADFRKELGAKKALGRKTTARSVGTLEEIQSWRIVNLQKDEKTAKTVSRCATVKAIITAKGTSTKYLGGEH